MRARTSTRPRFPQLCASFPKIIIGSVALAREGGAPLRGFAGAVQLSSATRRRRHQTRVPKVVVASGTGTNTSAPVRRRASVGGRAERDCHR